MNIAIDEAAHPQLTKENRDMLMAQVGVKMEKVNRSGEELARDIPKFSQFPAIVADYDALMEDIKVTNQRLKIQELTGGQGLGFTSAK